jgi:hypothetical protein
MAIEFLEQPGSGIWTAFAPNWEMNGSGQQVRIGVSKKAIEARMRRGQSYALAELYGVIGEGLHLTKHVFKGLRRGMHVNGDNNADEKKFTLTWRPPLGFSPTGNAQNFNLIPIPAPEGCVFGVYVTKNPMLTQYPDIFAWAEHWTWLPESPDLDGAPDDFSNRYDMKVWSR